MSEQYSKEIRSKATSDGNIELSIAKVEKPVPGVDEVLIEVQASPINPSDLGLLLSIVLTCFSPILNLVINYELI